MRIFATLAISLFLATPATSGDLIGGYLYVVGSIPAEVPAVEQTDFGKAVFRNKMNELSVEWSTKCGVNVDIWHTNLIHDEETPWTPNYWVAYIALEETAQATRDAAPTTDCAEGGYVKRGAVLFPSILFYCSMGDDGTEGWQQSCG